VALRSATKRTPWPSVGPNAAALKRSPTRVKVRGVSIAADKAPSADTLETTAAPFGAAERRNTNWASWPTPRPPPVMTACTVAGGTPGAAGSRMSPSKSTLASARSMGSASREKMPRNGSGRALRVSARAEGNSEKPEAEAGEGGRLRARRAAVLARAAPLAPRKSSVQPLAVSWPTINRRLSAAASGGNSACN